MAYRCYALGLIALGLTSCSSDEEFEDTVQVGGQYDMTVRNGTNACEFEDWVEGETATDIGLHIEQDRNDLAGRLEGSVGSLVVALALGTAEFTGTVAGNGVTLVAVSPYVSRDGSCTFSREVTLRGELNGNVMSGEIEHSLATNDAPGCEGMEDCVSVQTFDAIRTSEE
jgi:hypothetical protein